MALTNVQVAVNQSGFQTAAGTANWTKVVTLVPGTNIISARSFDQAGNFSAPTRCTYLSGQFPADRADQRARNGQRDQRDRGDQRRHPGPRTQLHRPGPPADNYLFTNWTSGTSPGALTNYPGGASLTFLMSTNMILQANFVTNPFPAAAGVYNGLFYPAGGVTEAGIGLYLRRHRRQHTGVYCGKLLWNGGSNYVQRFL